MSFFSPGRATYDLCQRILRIFESLKVSIQPPYGHLFSDLIDSSQGPVFTVIPRKLLGKAWVFWEVTGKKNKGLTSAHWYSSIYTGFLSCRPDCHVASCDRDGGLPNKLQHPLRSHLSASATSESSLLLNLTAFIELGGLWEHPPAHFHNPSRHC